MAKSDTSRSSTDVSPDALSKFKAIVILTDAFCKRYLNEEYVRMCRRLALALARKKPTPLARGGEKVWACGIVRTFGWANMLDDPKSSPYMKLIDIDPKFSVANSTGQGKCMAIKRMFGIGRLNPDWTLPSRLADNPLVWRVEVNGTLVDIREESREKQEAAFNEGLIPFIPADEKHPPAEVATEPQDKPTVTSVEGDLLGSLVDFYEKTMTLLRQSGLDDESLKLLNERIKLTAHKVIGEMERSRTWNVTEPLESAYDEIKRFAKELKAERQ